MKRISFTKTSIGFMLLFMLLQQLNINAQQPISAITGLHGENDINQKFTITNKTNLPGMDDRSFEIKEGGKCWECEQACLNDPGCKAFTLVKPGVQGPNAVCWLKRGVPRALPDENCISGIKKTAKSPDLILVHPVLENLQFDWPLNGSNIRVDFDIPGGDYHSFFISEGEPLVPFICQSACQGDPRCLAWSFVLPGAKGQMAECWLKDKVNPGSVKAGVISGVRILPTLKSAPTKNIKSTPELLQQNSLAIQQNWKSGIDKAVGNLNQQMIAGQQQYQRNYHIAMDKFAAQVSLWSALPDPMPSPACLIDYRTSQPEIVWQNGSGQKMKTQPPDLMMKQPEITRIVALVQDKVWQQEQGAVYDGHYIIIYGKNLGECPDGNCGIKIRYKYVPSESATFSGKKPTYIDRDLIPFQNNWPLCWNDNFIIAMVPVLPPREVTLDYPDPNPTRIAENTTLQIWKGGGQSYSLQYPVTYKIARPEIQYLQMSPSYAEGHISADADVYVYGSGFGAIQGTSKIYLEIPALNPSIIYPSNIQWSTNLIKIKIPASNVDINEIYEGKIHVFDQNNKPYWSWIKYGPRMISTVISGTEFLDIHISESEDGYKEEAYPEDQGQFLLVSHYPGCGTWDWSGEQGQDVFFGSNHPLSPYVHLQYLYFREIDPFQDEKNWNFLKDELGPALLNPYYYGLKWGVVAIASMFVQGIGDYEVEIAKKPSWEDPETRIFYNNTCWFDYAGVPNRYMTAFSLRGPEHLTPGSPNLKQDIYQKLKDQIKQ